MSAPPSSEEVVEKVGRAIWREDHYDPKLCGHGGEHGLESCAYCEAHNDDTPTDWPADKERTERQARAAIVALPSTGIDELVGELEGIANAVRIGAETDVLAWANLAHACQVTARAALAKVRQQ